MTDLICLEPKGAPDSEYLSLFATDKVQVTTPFLSRVSKSSAQESVRTNDERIDESITPLGTTGGVT